MSSVREVGAWQFLDRATNGREESNHPDWPRRSDEYAEEPG